MTIIFAILSIILFKRPYYSSMLLALVISLSPIVNNYLLNNGSYILIFFIASILIIHIIKDRLIRTTHLLILLSVFFLILIQFLLQSLSITQIMISIYKFILIPFVVYFSFIYSKKKNIKFSHILAPYIIINLIIVYYRTFIDYSFFGVINIYEGTNLESLFDVGGLSWRPSNLSSAIIFSIELVSFLALYYYENNKSRMFYFIAIISIIPLIVMRSRSSMIMIFVIILYHLIYKRRVLKIFFASFIFSLVIVLSEFADSFLEVITLKESSVSGRLGSVTKTINDLLNWDLSSILFGKGAGFANMEIVPGNGFNVYVENFHLSVLYDSGIFVFLFWIIINLYIIIFTIFKKKYFEVSIIILGVLMVNNFSSNLTTFPMIIMYYTLIFVQFDKINFVKLYTTSELST